MYRKGQGVPQDYKAAVSWYSKAAEQGYASAQSNLGFMYANGQLFSDTEVKKMTQTLRKVPFDFYYRYTCETPDGDKVFKHKIVDWEAGVLFWHCRQSHGIEWEKPFRAKLEQDLTGKDLMFLMGNQHRFQDQWLIISLIYPPKRKPVEVTPQGSLF